jgi:hypothetical protein
VSFSFSLSTETEPRPHDLHIRTLEPFSKLRDNLVYLCPECGKLHSSLVDNRNPKFFLAQHWLCLSCGGGGPWVNEFFEEYVFRQLPESLILSRLTALLSSPFPDIFRV